MIEIRVVDHGLGVRPEIQYRYELNEHEKWLDCNNELVEWSWWETAEWVMAEDG
jgi:hypothetical protein